MIAPSDSAGPTRRQIPALLGLLVVGLVLWLAMDQRETLQGLWLAEPRVAVALGDREYELGASEAPDLEQLSRDHLHGSEERLRQELEGLVATELDALFSDLHERVPHFADWYYSLGGEYARLSFWALDQAGITDGGYVIDRMQALIFDQADYAERLARLHRAGALSIETRQKQARNEWLDHLLERLDGRERQPVTGREPELRLSLDGMLPAVGGGPGSDFETRLAVSGAAASGAGAATTAWRLFGRRTATAASSRLAVRGTTRGAARAGTSAGAGAVLCAPGGPAAFACGLVAGGAVWLATDWGLLQLDALRNREAMEDALHEAIATQRQDLEEQLLRHWLDVVEQHYQGMQREVERTFIPIRALSAG